MVKTLLIKIKFEDDLAAKIAIPQIKSQFDPLKDGSHGISVEFEEMDR